MISKARDPFINLVDKKNTATVVEGPTEPKPRGPSLYVSNVSLPITDDDLEQILIAEVKLKIDRITKNVINGKTSNSYDFEVKGIRFKR